MGKIRKYLFTFRIDPKLKDAAKRAALEAKLTLSRYVEDLVRRDVWRKGLLN
jgi:predicted HicB family RNase H-like nuclease